MELLVIRHGAAEPRETFAETGKDDSERPLTEKGRKRVERASRGLHTLVPHIDVLATSPFARSMQTAEVLAATYGDVTPQELEALAPHGERRSVLTWLQMHERDSTVAVVGHEPDLGRMVSWLVATPDSHFVQLKKGGACLLYFPSHVTAGDAKIRWLLPVAQLRKLAKKKADSQGLTE